MGIDLKHRCGASRCLALLRNGKEDETPNGRPPENNTIRVPKKLGCFTHVHIGIANDAVYLYGGAVNLPG